MFCALMPLFVYGGEELFKWSMLSFANVVSFYDDDGTHSSNLKYFFEQAENQYKLLDYCDSSTHIYELIEHFINKSRTVDTSFYWLLAHMKNTADFTQLPVENNTDDADDEDDTDDMITINIPEADMQISASYYNLKQLKTIIEFGIFTYVEKNKKLIAYELRRSLQEKYAFIDALFI